jgi:hypothetical protein
MYNINKTQTERATETETTATATATATATRLIRDVIYFVCILDFILDTYEGTSCRCRFYIG